MAAAERAEGSAAVRDEDGHCVAHRERGDEPLRIEAEAEGGQRRVLPQQAWLGRGLGLGLGLRLGFGAFLIACRLREGMGVLMLRSAPRISSLAALAMG